MIEFDFWKNINTFLLIISIPLTFVVYKSSLKKNLTVIVSDRYLPSYLRRAVAYFIDLVICLNIGWLIMKVLPMTNYVHWLYIYLPLFTVIIFLYFVLLESSAIKGTLGKLSMGIEVVNIDGTGVSI